LFQMRRSRQAQLAHRKQINLAHAHAAIKKPLCGDLAA